jgi:RNA polymerase sigma factor (TIGR02999 family)
MGRPSTMPNPSQPASVTRLLRAWQAGDDQALDQLVPVVYGELKRLARLRMRGERPGLTLQPSALVNEAYLRLAGLEAMQWASRNHFFSMASRVMRRVLVEAARARQADKRGDGAIRVTLDPARIDVPAQSPDVVALDEALTALGEMDPRKARVVELRFFGGLTVDEVAALLDLSPETVARDWRTAKLWLRRELSRQGTRT